MNKKTCNIKICHAECCGIVPIPIQLFEEKKYLIREPYLIDKIDNFLEMIYSVKKSDPTVCSFLADDYSCIIYQDRPEVCKLLCIENPKGYLNSHWRKPDQIIQPYFFGDDEMKTTCLWLRGLPFLQHHKDDDLFFKRTHIEKPEPKRLSTGKKTKGQKIYLVESNPGGKNGSKIRSKTFPGIAQAMADQWGKL